MLKTKAEAERALHNAFKAMDRKNYPPMYENEVSASNPTPLSDGKHVWVLVGTGVVACYDLEGTRRWINGFDLPLTTMYGRTASPVLVAERLLVHFGPLVCLDAATGKRLWKSDNPKATYGTPGGPSFRSWLNTTVAPASNRSSMLNEMKTTC